MAGQYQLPGFLLIVIMMIMFIQLDMFAAMGAAVCFFYPVQAEFIYEARSDDSCRQGKKSNTGKHDDAGKRLSKICNRKHISVTCCCKRYNRPPDGSGYAGKMAWISIRQGVLMFSKIHDTGSNDDEKNSQDKTKCQLIFPFFENIGDHMGWFGVGRQPE